MSYQLSESAYAANEVEETWTHRLLAAFEGAVTWLQPLLTTNNYEVQGSGWTHRVKGRVYVFFAITCKSRSNGGGVSREAL